MGRLPSCSAVSWVSAASEACVLPAVRLSDRANRETGQAIAGTTRNASANSLRSASAQSTSSARTVSVSFT